MEQTWTAGDPASPLLHRLAQRVEQLRSLDGPAEKAAERVHAAIGEGGLKDALAGRWLGHPLHPLLTDLPIGAWTSALVLDLVGGRQAAPAADRLVAVGLLAALPTAVTGLSEWSDSAKVDPRARRVGVVHALANVAAVGLYAASLAARRNGRRGRGVALSAAGAAATGVGGHLGGHLAYGQGVGVEQTVFEAAPEEWTDALAESALPDGAAVRAEVDGLGVVLVRQHGRIHALSDRCCHRGGPLHEGQVGDGQITCPWHGSTFRLQDGSVVRGPAAAPQPAWDVRTRAGRVEVRRTGVGPGRGSS